MSRIWITDRYVELQLSFDELDIDLQHIAGNLHRVPRKQDIYRCSLRLLPDVLAALRGWNEDNVPEGKAKEALLTELTRQRTNIELKTLGTLVEYPGLWEHQNLGVELARYNDRYNFFYDTRTGKTRMSYQIMVNALRKQPDGSSKIKRVLVITPATIIPSWLKDAEAFPGLKVAAFYGVEKQKKEALHTPCHVMLWSAGMVTQNLDFIEKIGFDMVFFDESSKAKSHRSKLSESLLKLSQKVKYWYNLSATPAPNGEYEYFRQMQYVDPYAFNPAWTQFKVKYFDNLSYSPKFEKLYLKPNMKQEFMHLIEDRSIYVDQSVMPMSKSTWYSHYFFMDEKQEGIYEDMRKACATELDEAKIIVDSAAIARAKLQQITSGFVMDTDARKANEISRRLGEPETEREVYQLEHNPRIAALLDLLHIIGWNVPTIIWAHYEQEFKDIQKAIGKGACEVIRGETPVVDKLRYIRAFQEGSLHYLVCHPLSVGMGINLTVSHNAIYYRIVDSWEAVKQSSERIRAHISIQPFDCNYYVLLACKRNGGSTVDQLVYDNVQNKRDASTGFLEYLRSGEYDGRNDPRKVEE